MLKSVNELDKFWDLSRIHHYLCMRWPHREIERNGRDLGIINGNVDTHSNETAFSISNLQTFRYSFFHVHSRTEFSVWQILNNEARRAFSCFHVIGRVARGRGVPN
jgi:hypothetical protein